MSLEDTLRVSRFSMIKTEIDSQIKQANDEKEYKKKLKTIEEKKEAEKCLNSVIDELNKALKTHFLHNDPNEPIEVFKGVRSCIDVHSNLEHIPYYVTDGKMTFVANKRKTDSFGFLKFTLI